MRWRIGLSILRAQHRQFFFQLEDSFLEIFAINRHIERDVDQLLVAPMSRVLRVLSGADRFEPSR